MVESKPCRSTNNFCSSEEEVVRASLALVNRLTVRKPEMEEGSFTLNKNAQSSMGLWELPHVGETQWLERNRKNSYKFYRHHLSSSVFCENNRGEHQWEYLVDGQLSFLLSWSWNNAGMTKAVHIARRLKILIPLDKISNTSSTRKNQI